MPESLSFDSIISTLKSNSKTTQFKEYSIKELNLGQQRSILHASWNIISLPVFMSNLYDNFIKENVESLEEPFPITSLVTLVERPYIIARLRKISIGDEFKDNGKKTYTLDLPELDESTIPQPEDIEYNGVTIHIEVPTIEADMFYNEILLNEISATMPKNMDNLEETQYVQSALLYENYEIMKYIKSVSFNGTEYIFAAVDNESRNKMINSLNKEVADKITDFIKKVEAHKEIALSCTGKNGKKFIPDFNTLFLTK